MNHTRHLPSSSILKPGLIILALMMGLLSGAASAAVVTGRVRDAGSNSFLLGATVTLQELDRATTTKAGGEFHFGNVPAGDYTLTVASLGYADYSQPVSVAEAGAPGLEVALKSEVLALEKVVVEGTREGQARALQQKRSATNVMDVISADAVGKFPDGNAAEALRRVPGISLEIDQDEGRYVVVRGIDSALNTVTLNNQIVGTPSEAGNRGVAMDSVPADLISRLEVVKAVTPDMDANSIGGAINIVTQSAFDRPEGFTFGSVGLFYDDFGGRSRPTGSLTFGRLLGDEGKWGFVGAVSYSLKDVKSQTANTRSWAQVNTFWVPLTQQNYDYDLERERIGANVAFQYRPAKGHEVALRLNHNEFNDSEDRQSVLYEYRLGTLTNQTATSGANSQGRASRQFRDYAQTGTIDVVTLDGKHEVSGDARFTWQAGASRGSRDTHKRNDWEFRSATGAFPNTYDLSGEELVITPNTDAYYTAANYPFRRVRFRTDDEQEDVITAQADYQRDLALGSGNGFWKAGAKYISREKKDDRNNTNYDASATNFTLGETGLAGPDVPGYFDGLFRYGPTLNMDAIEAFFAANPTRFVFNSASTLADSTASDFEASEDVIAAYAMASVNFAKNWTVLAGVRAEKTDATYAANELFAGAYRWIDGGKDYTDVLPGVHVAWRPAKQAVVRFAWTNTLGRPRYSDLAPIRALDSIETAPGSGRYTGSLSGGNPDLDPFESMNFDLSLEYYFKDGGILSLGAFHKEIKNPIYDNVIFQTNVEYEGRLYDTLTFSGPANADKGKITGLEFNYQRFFTTLPAPFDGLGINVNYTLVDSSVRLFTRPDELPFFKQSDSIMNLALIYEKYGFEGRVSYSKNDDFLDDVGANPDTDIFVRGRAVVDAKVSYRFSRKFKVFVELLNLTEEPLREFTGARARENDFELYKWKAKVGLNFNL
jgi:TonB-dependent receptor